MVQQTTDLRCIYDSRASTQNKILTQTRLACYNTEVAVAACKKQANIAKMVNTQLQPLVTYENLLTKMGFGN